MVVTPEGLVASNHYVRLTLGINDLLTLHLLFD